MTPTQRSLDLLRRSGWIPWVVERWIPQARKRLDLWNFGDILAMPTGPRSTLSASWLAEPLLIVQTTSGSNVSARRDKILDNPGARQWLELGHQISIHGWRKLKVKRGGKAVRWTPRIEAVTLADFRKDSKCVPTSD